MFRYKSHSVAWNRQGKVVNLWQVRRLANLWLSAVVKMWHVRSPLPQGEGGGAGLCLGTRVILLHGIGRVK